MHSQLRRKFRACFHLFGKHGCSASCALSASFRSLTETIGALLPSLQKFFGCLLVFYYFFGIVGVGIFGGIELPTSQYVGNSFVDLWSAFMTLFELMIVNDWNVTMATWVAATGTEWSRLLSRLVPSLLWSSSLTRSLPSSSSLSDDALERKKKKKLKHKSPHRHHHQVASKSNRCGTDERSSSSE